MQTKVLIIISILFSLIVSAQTITMQNGSSTTCTGTFYDSGGSTGDYNSNENYTYTICTSVPGSEISVNFISFDVENNYDHLYIYNGNGTGTLIVDATGSGMLTGQTISSYGGTGCLTFVFTSDGSVTYPGWEATISCTFPCQDYDIDIISCSEPYYNTDTIQICQGTTVTFDAQGDYYNNNTDYTQADGTTEFTWDFGDGTDTTGIGLTSVSHTYNTGGGYYVTVEGVDISGCSNVNLARNMVMVSTTPYFTGTTLNPDTICLGQSVDLSGQVQTNTWTQPIPNIVSGLTFLPDGSGASYQTTISHSMFGQGQTLNNINNLLSICLNMEHSYLGDLTIAIECPSGQTVTFIQYPNGGGSTHLGEPCDVNPATAPGIGYDYCWTPQATGTMANAANTTYHDFTDQEGNLVTNHAYIPAGDYEPETPYTNLVGCDLNGDWTITVTDNLMADDGYIFYWGLNFDPSIIPPQWQFTNTYDSTLFAWTGNNITSQNNGTGIATPLDTGWVDYTFTVIDDFGCSYDTTLSVFVLPPGSPGCCTMPTPNAGQNDETCDLSIGLNGILSDPSNSVNWNSNGPGTVTFSNQNIADPTVTVSTYGTYSFFMTETMSATCTTEDTVIITFNPPPVVNITSTQTLCFGSADGSLSVDTTGIIQPCQYLWDDNNSQNTQTATGLSAGTYNVTLTNGNGCTNTGSGTVTEPPQLTATTTTQNTSCYGNSDGWAFVNLSGGTAPYTYLWNDPMAQTTDSATALSAGSYNVVVTDANNCTITETVQINEPTEIQTTTNSTPVSCYGGSDGTTTVTANGGTPPYSYLWDDAANQTTATATGLPAGQYNVTITDDNNCTTTATANVSEPANPLQINLTGTDISCFGGDDGTITTSISGGTPSYTTYINGSQTSQNINNITAGTYTILVEDANGCSTSDDITLNQPTELTYTTSSVQTSCYGTSDGSATVTVANGTPPYSYFWNNGSTGATNNNVAAGNYQVTVTDNNGCTFSTSVNVDQPSKVMASVSSDVTICIGQSTTLSASATGGSQGYTFHWNTGVSSTSITVDPDSTTTYSVYAEDSEGCTSNNISITVSVNQPITTSISANDYDVCPGDKIIISDNTSGGNGNYFFTLNGDTITMPHTIYPPSTISYTIIAHDDCGSPTDQGSINVTVFDLPPNSFQVDDFDGCQPHTVNFTETSTDNGQTYLWNFGDDNSNNVSDKKNPSHTYQDAGTYDVTLTVTSTDECVNTNVIEDLVVVYPNPVAKFSAEPEVTSVVNPVIQFTNRSYLGNIFHWDFGDGDSSSVKHPSHAYLAKPAVYTVQLIVETDKGCSDTTKYTVRVRDEYTFYTPNAFSPNADGTNDEFMVFGNGIDAENFTMMIYNRWGEMIFMTNDPNKHWDGKAKDGKKLVKNGVYTWYVIYRDKDDVEHEVTGAVTVIR